MPIVIIFSAALFVSALLLFLVQPMFAKMVLPLLGGSPSVWTTCVLFFQAGLLAGYAYAHLLTTRLSIRWQAAVHAAVVGVPLALLPFALPATPAEGQVVSSEPALWLLWVLATTVGLPFFALSATAPLLQRWFSAVRHAFAGDPYFFMRRATPAASPRCSRIPRSWSRCSRPAATDHVGVRVRAWRRPRTAMRRAGVACQKAGRDGGRSVGCLRVVVRRRPAALALPLVRPLGLDARCHDLHVERRGGCSDVLGRSPGAVPPHVHRCIRWHRAMAESRAPPVSTRATSARAIRLVEEEGCW